MINAIPAAIDVVRKLVSAILDLVPEEQAAQMLTEEAVKRQNAVADAAELAKFGET